MTKNPFTTLPIRDPNLLIGRENLLARVQNSLDSGPVLLFGGRRTGKTSLLRCLEAKIQESPNETWLYWDAQNLPSGCGLDGACKKFGLSAGLEKEIVKYASNGGRLVLQFDEFDCLSTEDEDGIPRFGMNDFEILRSLLGAFDKHFSIIAASSRDLPEITIRGSELFNMFLPVSMKSLDLQSPEQFYQQYLEKSGLPQLWYEKKPLFEKACNFALLHPWLLQHAGIAVFSSGDLSEYYNQIVENAQFVSRHFCRALDSLPHAEAVWFCLCCREVPEETALNLTKYEALGLTVKGKVPEVMQLAALEWLAKIPPQYITGLYSESPDDKLSVSYSDDGNNFIGKENSQNSDAYPTQSRELMVATQKNTYFNQKLTAKEDEYWEQLVKRMTGIKIKDAIKYNSFVEAVRLGYLKVTKEGFVEPNINLS